MLSIYINGTDRSGNIEPRTVSIVNSLTDEVDTCRFEFETTDVSEKPVEGEEIIVCDDAEKVFGGIIVSAPEAESVPGRFVYQVECTDYQRQLDKKLVIRSYENMTAGSIICDIIDGYCSGFTHNNVQDGPLVESIPFNYKYPSECFKQLADLASFNWYIDYDRDVHFFDQFTNTAPFNLDDTQSNFSELELQADISQLRNRVYFRGGTYLSDPFTETQAGGKDVWVLGYKPSDISITVNGVAKTVGIENIDNKTAYDFMVNYQERHVIPGTISTTTADNIAFTYKYEVPVITSVDDAASINRMASLDGGDGIYEHVILNKEVTTKELARQMSQADLNQYANPLVTGSFRTNADGLRSGQLIHITQSARGIDDDYLIRRVSMVWKSVDTYEYVVDIASKLKGVEDLMVELFKRSQKIEVASDEVLDQLLVLRDTLKVTDAISYTTGAPEHRVGYGSVGYMEVG